MPGRPRRHVYFWDGERRVAEPLDPRWYTRAGEAELNERLRAPPVALRLRALAKKLPPGSRPRLPAAVLSLSREVMSALYARAEPLATRHLRDFPLPEIDPERFASPPGRAASERYLRILQVHEAAFRPKPVKGRDVVPPIVVFGTSRSAESLRMHALSGPRIAWALLENQRGSAHADYCLDVTAVGTDTANALLDHWWEGRDPSDHGIQEAYDTLFHETLHRLCDMANPFGPQYGPKGSQKEHYWMTEYEPFASHVERTLMEHLSEGREQGILRGLGTDEARDESLSASSSGFSRLARRRARETTFMESR